MKRTLLIVLAVVLLISIPLTAATAQAKQLRIGYITRLSVPWWIVCQKGFEDAAAKFGFKAVIYHPPQLTVEDQVRVLESWVAAGIDGVLIGPNDPAAPINAINEAIDAGVPVITGYGVDSPDSKRLLFEGYDGATLGVDFAKGLIGTLKLKGITSGKVSYHTGGMQSTEDVSSFNAFKQVVEDAGYTVVEPVLDGGDPAKALASAAETISLYPDLVGMIGFYDYTGPALGKAVTDADKIGQIVVVAGLIGQVVPFMRSGAVSGVIDYVQYDGSYKAGEMLYKLAKAGKANWTKVLKTFKKDYPENKLDLQGFGYVTNVKLNLKPWPEIGWIKTLDDHMKQYPKVWDILK